MISPACIDRDELSRFLTGDIAPGRAEHIIEHIDLCSSCQESVTSTRSPDPLLASLRDLPVEPIQIADSACRRALDLAARPSSLGGAARPALEVGKGSSIGPYELVSFLGRGGMGVVYKARHVKLKRTVALKVLNGNRLDDPQQVGRFELEMEAVGTFDHPNIVAATDAGDDQGQHYIAMEYVDGLDLAAIARTCGPLSPADACELARQTALALVAIQQHGLVHRDIKPSNLMLDRQGRVKVLDLGLALLDDIRFESNRELTTVGQLMGTLDYMSPEQGRDSHEVDIRADIYSLGATLYKLLTGQSPLETGSLDSPLKKMTALATQSAPSLGAMRTDLPNDLVRLVDGMLSREPHDRLNDPAEIAERLEPLAQASDLPRLLRAARACPENKAKGFPDDIVSRAERRSPRKLNPFVAALVALLLMGVGAAGVIVIRLADNRGELVIDSEADVRVVVKQLDGPHEADLSIQKGVNSIQLQAGDYRVDVESQRNDELVIEGSTFEIVRDGKAIARIEHRPDRVKLPAAGQGSSGQANSGATNIGATKTGEATFDGRTLADWKRQLRTELHPQRLDEAVSAMVALSRDREAEVAAEFAALAHRVSDSQAGSVRFSARSRSGALRKSAATGLIALPVPAIAPHVEQMLNSKTPQVVYIAIYVLQDSVETHPAPAEFKALAPKLMELTEAGHSDVRAMALSALAKIDFELIRKQLFDSLLADDLGVWKMAYSLIESVLPDDPARYDALRKRLRRYDPERDSRDELVALMQICASANRRVPFDDQFVEPLMRIIEHPSDEIGKTLDHSTLSARGAACQILSSMDALARSALPRLQELRQERIDALRKTSSRSGRFDPRGTPDDQALAAAVSKISRAVRELESQEVAPKQ